jgi:predicted transposase YdaD
MTEEDVEQKIKTPDVRKAFELAKLVNLPERIKKNYDEEDTMYHNLAGHIAEEVAKGQTIGEAIGEARGQAIGEARGQAIGEVKKARSAAKVLLNQGVPMSTIMAATSLSEEEINNLKD